MAIPGILARFTKNSKKSETKHKKIIFEHGLLLCPLVAIKNDEPEIFQTLHKVASQGGLSSMNMRMGFKAT